MSLPEVVLWDCLRMGRLEGLRFRRQHPIGPWILDFYCPSARMAVEVDGASHEQDGQIRHDARRTAWLRDQQIRILRFDASDILRDATLDGVLATILATATGQP